MLLPLSLPDHCKAPMHKQSMHLLPYFVAWSEKKKQGSLNCVGTTSVDGEGVTQCHHLLRHGEYAWSKLTCRCTSSKHSEHILQNRICCLLIPSLAATQLARTNVSLGWNRHPPINGCSSRYNWLLIATIKLKKWSVLYMLAPISNSCFVLLLRQYNVTCTYRNTTTSATDNHLGLS
jgi:hypothetical protein